MKKAFVAGLIVLSTGCATLETKVLDSVSKATRSYESKNYSASYSKMHEALSLVTQAPDAYTDKTIIGILREHDWALFGMIEEDILKDLDNSPSLKALEGKLDDYNSARQAVFASVLPRFINNPDYQSLDQDKDKFLSRYRILIDSLTVDTVAFPTDQQLLIIQLRTGLKSILKKEPLAGGVQSLSILIYSSAQHSADWKYAYLDNLSNICMQYSKMLNDFGNQSPAGLKESYHTHYKNFVTFADVVSPTLSFIREPYYFEVARILGKYLDYQKGVGEILQPLLDGLDSPSQAPGKASTGLEDRG